MLFLLAGCLAPDPPPAQTCTSCHGSPETGPAPPAALGGYTDREYIGVGAHQAHLNAALAPPLACTECHVDPDAIDAPGHLYDGVDDDTPRAEVGWGGSAIAGRGASPYDAETGTCLVYCHGGGDVLTGGSATAPAFTDQGIGCGSCHGNPPPPPDHPDTAAACGDCHVAETANHVDGSVDLQ